MKDDQLKNSTLNKLEKLQQELDGELQYSGERREELKSLVADIKKSHQSELQQAKKSKVGYWAWLYLGFRGILNVIKFFGDGDV